MTDQDLRKKRWTETAGEDEEGAEHSVLPRADHVIMSSKKKREIAATDEEHGSNVTEWSTVKTLMRERNNIHLRSAHGGVNQ